MDTDRNLLFGVISMQVGLIEADQFIEICGQWATRKSDALADLLTNRGWISQSDRAHIEYLLDRRLEKTSGDIQASLASLPVAVQRSLHCLGDPLIQQSLSLSSGNAEELDATRVFRAERAHGRFVHERYELQRIHASGGMGCVWLAADKRLDRTVALKGLKSELADDQVARLRFHREARITSQLEHPGIVPVYDFVVEPDRSQSFYTMRFVRGKTLYDAASQFHEARLRGDADLTDLAGLLNAFVTICKTVAYAHSRGVIHRDLKGQNIILGSFGETVVLDWGFARYSSDAEIVDDGDPKDTGQLSEFPSDSDLTRHGETMGTPSYMSPEQADGRLDNIDCRADVYGLGAILYHLLTGQPPFAGATIEELLQKVRSEPPLTPRQLWTDVPPTLEQACLRALAKDPADRFESAMELAREVEQWQEVQLKRAELALRDSEALFRSLVDVMPLILVRKDLAHRFTFANQRFCDAVDRPLEEILGKTDFDFFPEEIAAEYQLHDREVFESLQAQETEETFIERGETREIQVIKTPTWDADGKLNGLQIIVWDVTEHKQLEQTLRESEAFYQALVESLPQGILRKDMEGRFTYANHGACEMLGLSRQEIVGKTDIDICPQELAAKYRQDDLAVIQSGQRQEVVEVNETIGTPNHYVQTIKTPVYDQEGKPIGIQAIFWDVTEQRHMQESLEEKSREIDRLREEVEQLKLLR